MGNIVLRFYAPGRPYGTKTLVLAAVLTAGALSWSAQDARAQAPATTDTISKIVINGTGEVAARADMAIIGIGVDSAAATATTALNDNSRAMAAIIKMLRGRGIEARDIITASFDLQPRYDQRNYNDSSAPGAPQILGYVVSNQLSVRIRSVEETGSILDEAARAGANRFHGVHFSFADPKTAIDTARNEAMEDARAKAELYAKAAGVQLGRILLIEETGAGRRGGIYARSASLQQADLAVPIEAGEQSVQAGVRVTWALRN